MKILATTGLASIQDLGRYGGRSQGINVSGAMDGWALQAGNALVGNLLDAPAIELTLGGLTATFEQPATFCLTGAMMEAFLDETPIANGWVHTAQAGQTLKITRAVQGMHGYICLKNGFDIPKILDSFSTNLKAEFGGLNGKLLAAGDSLPEVMNEGAKNLSKTGWGIDTYHEPLLLSHSQLSHSQFAKNAATPNPTETGEIIRVMKNSEADYFTQAALETFTQQVWKLSSSSNRMGYRLEGQATLDLQQPLQMNSHGVAMGMIQVPPQGQPIVLMADAQTTGGYPKIATVIAADLGRFSQIRFGQKCQFVWVTLEEAIYARNQRQRYIARIQAMHDSLINS